jgi:PAS domain S-box-containing protein
MQEAKIQYILKRLNEELREFISTMNEISYVAMPSERPEIICFAEKIKELSGYSADEILASREHWANLIYPDDRQKVFTVYAECKNLGVSFGIEYRIVHKNGTLRYVKDKGSPLFDDRGNIIHIEGAIVAVGLPETVESMAVLNSPRITAFSNGSLQALRKIKMGQQWISMKS